MATKSAMLTPDQLRAARALVNWSREELARRSGSSGFAIKSFEIGRSDPRQGTILAWKRALQDAGVRFLDDDGVDGAGVRLKNSAPKQQHRKNRRRGGV